MRRYFRHSMTESTTLRALLLQIRCDTTLLRRELRALDTLLQPPEAEEFTQTLSAIDRESSKLLFELEGVPGH
jgi:hypothetical protein